MGGGGEIADISVPSSRNRNVHSMKGFTWLNKAKCSKPLTDIVSVIFTTPYKERQ